MVDENRKDRVRPAVYRPNRLPSIAQTDAEIGQYDFAKGNPRSGCGSFVDSVF